MASPDPAAVSVLSVGDELLSGEVVNTNLASIGRRLSSLGIAIGRQVTVPDVVEDIIACLDELCSAADAVIVTGGLGPTNDDLTTEAVAKAAGVGLELRPHLKEGLEAFFESMGRPMVEENLKQAYLPEGAAEIPPAGGTAAGFMLEHGGALVAVLPGVPREMEQMLDLYVLPELERRSKGRGATITRRLNTFGAGESDVANMVSDRIRAGGPVSYGFLAQAGIIVVKLTATAAAVEEAEAMVLAEQALVAERLGELVYSTEDEQMEEVVGGLLRRSGLTIAAAESVTAGMVCSRLTNVPGSSEYFLGGAITYSIDSKRRVLGIPGELLAEGAVNREVAEAMAASVRAMYGADIGVSTTGVAGPGTGGELKPTGTACVALAHQGGVFSLERRLPGHRGMVRTITTLAALNLSRLHVEALLEGER